LDQLFEDVERQFPRSVIRGPVSGWVGRLCLRRESQYQATEQSQPPFHKSHKFPPLDR
jgi:hypothetical protein